MVAAGSIATAADVNNLTRKVLTANASSVTQAVTTTVADLAGATKSVTTAVDNTEVLVRGIFDVESTHASDIFVGTCMVDVTSQSGEAHWQGVGRGTILNEWLVTLGAADTYTIKLRVQKVNNSGTVTAYGSSHSKIVIEGNGIS